MTHDPTRERDLRNILLERRSGLEGEVQHRLREWRKGRPDEGGDGLEHSGADNQGEMELALTQMRAETLARIREALARLDAGRYGFCFECDEEIAESRLRALPFAVRCQACEQQREQVAREPSSAGPGRRGASRFPHIVGS